MADLKLRDAFDSESVPLKNIALKKAYIRIEKLEAALERANATAEEYERKFYLGTDRIEKLEAALRDVLTDLEGENWLPDGLLGGYIYVKARKALEGKDD